MQHNKLIYMANQIANAFGHLPEDKAVTEIAQHLKKFWEKRMLAKIFTHLEAGGEGLQQQVKLALAKLRYEVPPTANGFQNLP